MDEKPEASVSLVPPRVFDQVSLRLIAAALAVGVLLVPVLIFWRGFSWLMALASAAGIALLIGLSGRAARVLNFEWRRPPFERED